MVVVLLRVSDRRVSERVNSDEDELVMSVSEGRGVGAGVVRGSSEGSAVGVTMAEASVMGGTVNEPTSERETTAPVGSAGTSVILEVVVPSLTLISMTLAVTVASGARGKM